MSTIGKRVIYVGPADGANHKPLTVEGPALLAIRPGALVDQIATGLNESGTAATEYGAAELLVANKDEARSRSVDDSWTAGENAVAIKPRSGEFVNMLVAAGNNITSAGTPMSSNGDGTLKIAVTPDPVGATSEQVLCHADEIINVTGSAALVRVRVA